jgi:uncharacterized lipoprotein YddW (UPF0748 family)
MFKKVTVILFVLLLLSSCSLKNINLTEPESASFDSGNDNCPNTDDIIADEYRGVWINYNELSMKSVGGGTAEDFKNKIDTMFENIKAFGLNTVIFQVRPFSDSFCSSEIFPWSSYITGEQGKNPGYDPFLIATNEAEKYGLKIEAWINPYRVSYKDNFDDLSESNPAKQWYTDNPLTDDLIITGSGIYYNPSSKRAQKIIIDGVREIVKNYNISAIHMDDYFYPTVDEGIDVDLYTNYRNEGGELSLDDWRRENVNTFISGLYSSVKSIKQDVKVVISPAGDIEKNYSMLYADVLKWCSQGGYADIIMPQLYYGFKNSSKPFLKMLNLWSEAVKSGNVKLCIGLAYYKSGKTDDNAGDGINEWCENGNICSEEIRYSRRKDNYCGFSVYSYSYLFAENKSENTEKEYLNMKNVL